MARLPASGALGLRAEFEMRSHGLGWDLGLDSALRGGLASRPMWTFHLPSCVRVPKWDES